MAKLKNTYAFRKNGLSQSNCFVKVGNNRLATHYTPKESGVVYETDYSLHGTVLVRAQWIDTNRTLRVSVCDGTYPSNTTRNAIQDFLRGLGLSAGASVAGGNLSIRVKDVAHGREDVQGVESGDVTGIDDLGFTDIDIGGGIGMFSVAYEDLRLTEDE